jgi:hypothetical protein
MSAQANLVLRFPNGSVLNCLTEGLYDPHEDTLKHKLIIWIRDHFDEFLFGWKKQENRSHTWTIAHFGKVLIENGEGRAYDRTRGQFSFEYSDVAKILLDNAVTIDLQILQNQSGKGKEEEASSVNSL